MFFTIITVGIIIFLIRHFLNKFYGSIDPNNEISARGKLVVITGANTGVGYSTALEFAKRDAHVILACRSLSKANDAICSIKAATCNGQLEAMLLDLNSFLSVRKFAAEFNKKYDKLDILVNNAAVMLNPEKKLRTDDGFEIHFGVNHLGHFLLTKLLLEKLKNAGSSRIVTVSAIAHTHGSVDRILSMGPSWEAPEYEYSFLDSLFLKQIGPGNKPYSDSKLANALFSKELARRLKGTGVRTYALCPGVVSTGLADTLDIPKLLFYPMKLVTKLLLKTPEQGCWTTMYCALSKDVIHQSGEMYQHCKFWDPKDRIPLRDEDAEKLWNLSEKLTGIIPP